MGIIPSPNQHTHTRARTPILTKDNVSSLNRKYIPNTIILCTNLNQLFCSNSFKSTPVCEKQPDQGGAQDVFFSWVFREKKPSHKERPAQYAVEMLSLRKLKQEIFH